MRQSLIRVLQSFTRTAVSHYLQIHLGPAPGQIQARPRRTIANQWPNTQPRLMYFSRYTAKYISSSHVGCTELCVRVRMQLSVCVIPFECGCSCGLWEKKQRYLEFAVWSSTILQLKYCLDNQKFTHTSHFTYIYLKGPPNNSIYHVERFRAAAG